MGETKLLKLFPEFKGVDVKRTPLKMPLSLSPLSVNSDFDRNSLRKRNGMRKVHKYAVPPAGLKLYGTDPTADAGPYVFVHDHADYDLGTEWTVEFKIKIHGGALFAVLCKGDNQATPDRTLLIALGLHAASDRYSLFWTFEHTAAGGTTTLATGTVFLDYDKEYHVAIARIDANTVKTYVDGVEKASTATTSANANTTNADPLIIGGAYNSVTPGVIGIPEFTMSELRIWKGHARSTTELSNYSDVELDLDDDPDCADFLVGYWHLNEGDGRIVYDASKNRNPGFFNKSQGIYVPSPFFEGSEDFALVFDGYDDYGVIPYDAAYEPIDDTSKHWTVEVAFMPYWINTAADNVIVEMGKAFQFRIESTGGDYEGAYTDSGAVTETCASGVRAEAFVPAMLSLVRDYDDLHFYVNGVLVDSQAVASANAGGDDDNDIYLGRKSDGTLKSCGAFDEIRLWTYSRSADQILENHNRRLPNEQASGLVGYWRCNAYSVLLDASDTDNDGTIYPTTESMPDWGEGLITTKTPPTIRAVSDFNIDLGVSGQSFRQDKASVPKATKRRIVFNCGGAIHELIPSADEIRVIGNSFRSKYPISICKIQRHLILANGSDKARKYDGEREPYQVGIDAPASAPTAASGAAGNPNGAYYGFYTYYNSKTGMWSLASPVSAQISVTNQKITWTVVATSDPNIDTIRIYRTLAAGSSTGTFYLATIGANASGNITDDTADADLGVGYDAETGVMPVVSCVAAYQGMLFGAGNPAASDTLYVSELREFEHAYATNLHRLGVNEGDPITALHVLSDDLIAGKKHSIWRVNGRGPTTLNTHIITASHGILNPQAISSFNLGQADFLVFIDLDGIWAYASGTFRKLSTPFDAWFDGTVTRLNASKLHENVIADFRLRNEVWASCQFGEPEIDLGEVLAKFEFEQDPTSLGGSEIRDLSGHSRHLTSNGTMTSADKVSGVYGYATDLEGTDDYFTMPAECLINARTFSVGLWVKFDEITGEDGYVLEYANAGDNRYWNLRLDDGNSELRFNLYDGSSTYHADIPFASLTAGGWHHVVCTHNGDKSSIYLDGALVESVDAEAASYGQDEGSDFHIGRDVAGTASAYLDGKIDHLIISRTVWNADTIRKLYEEGKAALGGSEPLAAESKTLIINYRTGRTRVIDRAFATLKEIEMDDGSTKFLVADDTGFVYEANTLDNDGAGVSGTVTGTLTSAGADTLTDSAATFYTDGDGLKGVEIWAVMTNGVIQKRTIQENTATQITVVEKWSPTTITGATYYIGPINFVHRTPILDGGAAQLVKKWNYMQVLQEKQDEVDKPVSIKTSLDMASTFTERTTINTDDFTLHANINQRSRTMQYEIEQYHPNVPVEILEVEQEFEVLDAKT